MQNENIDTISSLDETTTSTQTEANNSEQTISDPAKPLEVDATASIQSIEEATETLKKAQKDYDESYKIYEETKEKYTLTSDQLAKAELDVNNAESAVENARNQMNELQDKAAASNSAEDKAAYEAATAEYNKAQDNLEQAQTKLDNAQETYDELTKNSEPNPDDDTQSSGTQSSGGTQNNTGDFEPYKAPEVPDLVTDKPSWETPISTKATGYANYLLGEKTYTNIDYDSILFTCQNIRDNIIPDLMTIMDDFTEMYQKRDSIWHGQAGEKYFVDFRKDLERYKTYLEQCSLERYIRAVEQLVADNKTTDKEITADDIAKINDEIPFIFPVDFSTAGIDGNSTITDANEAEGGVHEQVDTGKDEGQNDTSNVGTNDNIGANINNDTVDGQNDTSKVGTNDNIGANINNDTVDGQNDTSKVGAEDLVEASTNVEEANGQNDTSKIGSSQDIDASASTIEAENSNYEESLKAALLSNFNDITGGDE